MGTVVMFNNLSLPRIIFFSDNIPGVPAKDGEEASRLMAWASLAYVCTQMN